MDEGKAHKQVQRGKQADNLLKNKIFNEVLDKIETDLYEAWKASGAAEGEQRENAYKMHRLLQNLRSAVKQIANDGDYAQAQLLQLEEQRKRA